MTEKRFRVFKFPDVDKFGVSDDIAEVTVAFCDKKWEADYLCNLLNELHDEKESWRKSWIEELNDSEEQSKCILELVNANQQLQEQLDYIQNAISNAIKHQKTECGVKALKEIIGDYNEWMLGHKEVKE